MTFHPSLEQAVVVVDKIKHGYDLAETITECVELAEHVVLREAEIGSLLWQERLSLYQDVCVVVHPKRKQNYTEKLNNSKYTLSNTHVQISNSSKMVLFSLCYIIYFYRVFPNTEECFEHLKIMLGQSAIIYVFGTLLPLSMPYTVHLL